MRKHIFLCLHSYCYFIGNLNVSTIYPYFLFLTKRQMGTIKRITLLCVIFCRIKPLVSICMSFMNAYLQR